MDAAKTIFLRNDELVREAQKLLNSPTFESILLFARSSFMETTRPQEQVEGANAFLQKMLDLVEEPVEVPDVSSGLDHELKIPRGPQQEIEPETK